MSLPLLSLVLVVKIFPIEGNRSLKERIEPKTAKAIHIAFKKKAIMSAISQFTVHNRKEDELNTPLGVYSEETYISWGYMGKK